MRGDRSIHVWTQVGPDTIAPLFQLDLEVLKLEPGAPIDIDDEFVARIARAWPHLHMLELNADWRRYGAPRVTLMGLIPLAEHCPGITALAIPFDTHLLAFDEPGEIAVDRRQRAVVKVDAEFFKFDELRQLTDRIIRVNTTIQTPRLQNGVTDFALVFVG